MNLLTKRDILDNLHKGHLIFDANEKNVSTCSYDMTVGIIFRDGKVFDSKHPPEQGQVVIQPGELVTMLTAEKLSLPNDIAATAYAMNSQSSEGFLVLNPGHVDPGYEGPLEIKAVNLRKVPLALGIGDPIFTVIFQSLGQDTQGYDKNKSLDDKIRAVRKKDVELTIKSMGDLVALNSPFPTKEEVAEIITKHWASRAMFIFTLITMIAAVVAMVAGLIAAYPVIEGKPKTPNKIEITHQTSNFIKDEHQSQKKPQNFF